MSTLKNLVIIFALFCAACLGAFGFTFLIFYVEALLQ